MKIIFHLILRYIFLYHFQISDELRKKVVAAVAAKNRKASKNNPVKKLEKDIVVSDDEFDGMINDKEKRK